MKLSEKSEICFKKFQQMINQLTNEDKAISEKLQECYETTNRHYLWSNDFFKVVDKLCKQLSKKNCLVSKCVDEFCTDLTKYKSTIPLKHLIKKRNKTVPNDFETSFNNTFTPDFISSSVSNALMNEKIVDSSTKSSLFNQPDSKSNQISTIIIVSPAKSNILIDNQNEMNVSIAKVSKDCAIYSSCLSELNTSPLCFKKICKRKITSTIMHDDSTVLNKLKKRCVVNLSNVSSDISSIHEDIIASSTTIPPGSDTTNFGIEMQPNVDDAPIGCNDDSQNKVTNGDQYLVKTYTTSSQPACKEDIIDLIDSKANDGCSKVDGNTHCSQLNIVNSHWSQLKIVNREKINLSDVICLDDDEPDDCLLISVSKNDSLTKTMPDSSGNSTTSINNNNSNSTKKILTRNNSLASSSDITDNIESSISLQNGLDNDIGVNLNVKKKHSLIEIENTIDDVVTICDDDDDDVDDNDDGINCNSKTTFLIDSNRFTNMQKNMEISKSPSLKIFKKIVLKANDAVKLAKINKEKYVGNINTSLNNVPNNCDVIDLDNDDFNGFTDSKTISFHQAAKDLSNTLIENKFHCIMVKKGMQLTSKKKHTINTATLINSSNMIS